MIRALLLWVVVVLLALFAANYLTHYNTIDRSSTLKGNGYVQQQ